MRSIPFKQLRGLLVVAILLVSAVNVARSFWSKNDADAKGALPNSIQAVIEAPKAKLRAIENSVSTDQATLDIDERSEVSAVLAVLDNEMAQRSDDQLSVLAERFYSLDECLRYLNSDVDSALEWPDTDEEAAGAESTGAQGSSSVERDSEGLPAYCSPDKNPRDFETEEEWFQLDERIFNEKLLLLNQAEALAKNQSLPIDVGVAVIGWAMSGSDDVIKRAALALVGQMPVHREILDSLDQGLGTAVDGELVRDALDQIDRYLSIFEPQVISIHQKLIAFNYTDVGDIAARKAIKWLTPENVESYQKVSKWLHKMYPQSPQLVTLDRAIEDVKYRIQMDEALKKAGQ